MCWGPCASSGPSLPGVESLLGDGGGAVGRWSLLLSFPGCGFGSLPHDGHGIGAGAGQVYGPFHDASHVLLAAAGAPAHGGVDGPDQVAGGLHGALASQVGVGEGEQGSLSVELVQAQVGTARPLVGAPPLPAGQGLGVVGVPRGQGPLLDAVAVLQVPMVEQGQPGGGPLRGSRITWTRQRWTRVPGQLAPTWARQPLSPSQVRLRCLARTGGRAGSRSQHQDTRLARAHRLTPASAARSAMERLPDTQCRNSLKDAERPVPARGAVALRGQSTGRTSTAGCPRPSGPSSSWALRIPGTTWPWLISF